MHTCLGVNNVCGVRSGNARCVAVGTGEDVYALHLGLLGPSRPRHQGTEHTALVGRPPLDLPAWEEAWMHDACRYVFVFRRV